MFKNALASVIHSPTDSLQLLLEVLETRKFVYLQVQVGSHSFIRRKSSKFCNQEGIGLLCDPEGLHKKAAGSAIIGLYFFKTLSINIKLLWSSAGKLPDSRTSTISYELKLLFPTRWSNQSYSQCQWRNFYPFLLISRIFNGLHDDPA